MARSKKCVVIYTEGETECEFYDYLLEGIKIKYNLQKFSVDKISKKNLKGITKFDKKIIKKFENDMKTIYKGYEVIVFLCYDTDVFDCSAKPPVNWTNVEKELTRLGANKIYHLKAEKCIEDIFLLDLPGICNFLKISPIKKVSGSDGVDKLKNLFSKGNRIYQKGFSTKGSNRGLGLTNVKEIIDRNPNVNLETLIENNEFTQVVKIKD